MGDLVSDLIWIERFIKEEYRVTLSVSSWLVPLGRFLLPEARIVPAGSKEEVSSQRYDYDLIFLTPNYLHPARSNPRSVPAYIMKYLQVKKRSNDDSVIMHPSIPELLGYMFGSSDSYLADHFSLMSYGLLRKYASLFTAHPAILHPPPPPFKGGDPAVSELYIFPYSGNEAKNYPLDSYLKIARSLAADHPDLKILFFVTPKEYDATREYVGEFKVVSTSLENLCTLFGPKVLILCADSGPGHLGTYFKSNALVLFGMTDSKKYAPRGEGKILTLQSPSTRVADIPPSSVLQRIRESFTFPRSGANR